MIEQLPEGGGKVMGFKMSGKLHDQDYKFDILEQTLLAGVGLAGLPREKVQDLAAEVSRRAQLSQQEAKEFQAELVARADQARQDLHAEIDRRIDHAFIQLGTIIKAELDRRLDHT
jgi:polyhydroxyalkanoate synthesis regulator phasin